jgi:molybdopterin synthase catalytic subunit
MMKIDISFISAPICRPSLQRTSFEIGAIAEFEGIVRGEENGVPIDGLYYEAYERMADKIMRAIFEELANEHSCDAVEFIHRLGWVSVGESSLYIRVQSKHRGPAFGFLQECINRMKKDAPIWKVDSRGLETDLGV